MYPASLVTLKNNYNMLMLDCTYKTNQYNLLLCHVIDRSCQGKIFDIVYCFINHEREENYTLVVADLAEIYQDSLQGNKPTVLVTDKEKALKNALYKSTSFGAVPQIICRWYIYINVLLYTLTQWPDTKIK